MAIILPLLASCRQKQNPATADVTVGKPALGYADELLRERRGKDMAFRKGDTSPLSEEDRPLFRGLNYYPANPALRFRVKLNRYPAPRRIRLATNTGEVRNALRYGYFDFEIEGTTYRLQAYRMEEDQVRDGPSLFIPFRDATSGSETYAAGRYLELAENTTGIYDLDFNRAYNPYCAYRTDYSCPLPPAENILTATIRAGERTYRRF